MANKSAAVKLTFKITSLILRILLNVIFYILVAILIVNVSKKAFEFTYQLYGPVTVDAKGAGTSLMVQVKKGESTMDIASKLENLRAVKNKYSFYLKAKLENYAIMPGTYEISTDMTYKEILTIISDYSASIIKEEDTGGTGTGADTGTGTGEKSAEDSGTEPDKPSVTPAETNTDPDAD